MNRIPEVQLACHVPSYQDYMDRKEGRIKTADVDRVEYFDMIFLHI